jgi:anti-sigma factor RsiW
MLVNAQATRLTCLMIRLKPSIRAFVTRSLSATRMAGRPPGLDRGREPSGRSALSAPCCLLQLLVSTTARMLMNSALISSLSCLLYHITVAKLPSSAQAQVATGIVAISSMPHLA